MDQKKYDHIKIPSLPMVIQECVHHLYNPQLDIRALVETIQKDVEIIAKLLNMANSARFVGFNRTTDIRAALTRIGIQPVVQILIAQFFTTHLNCEGISFLNVTNIVKHSIWNSQIAFELGKILQSPFVHDLLVAGIFHDIGLIVRLYLNPADALCVVNRSKEKNQDIHSTEIELGLECHCSLGAGLLHTWNLPEQIIFLVKESHCFRAQQEKYFSRDQYNLLRLFELSNKIAHRASNLFLNYNPDCRINQMDLDILGISKEQITMVTKNLTSQLEAFFK